jgi:hypothetical protein
MRSFKSEDHRRGYGDLSFTKYRAALIDVVRQLDVAGRSNLVALPQKNGLPRWSDVMGYLYRGTSLFRFLVDAYSDQHLMRSREFNGSGLVNHDVVYVTESQREALRYANEWNKRPLSMNTDRQIAQVLGLTFREDGAAMIPTVVEIPNYNGVDAETEAAIPGQSVDLITFASEKGIEALFTHLGIQPPELFPLEGKNPYGIK